VWAGVGCTPPGAGRSARFLQRRGQGAARRAKLTDYAPEFLEPELTWAQALALQLKSRAAQALFRAGPGELALRESRSASIR